MTRTVVWNGLSDCSYRKKMTNSDAQRGSIAMLKEYFIFCSYGANTAEKQIQNFNWIGCKITTKVKFIIFSSFSCIISESYLGEMHSY